MSDKINIYMKKFVLILSLLPMLVLNLAPVSMAAADVLPGEMQEMPCSDTNSHKKNKDRSMWFQYLEALGEAEAEEKILSFQFYRNPFIASQYGFSLKDQFAIPDERSYLPDEPPIS